MNVLDLERLAVEARENGDSVEYTIFKASVGQHAARLAWLAAISLGISEENLVHTSARLWPDATNRQRLDASRALGRWPLVEHTAEGIRIVDWIMPVVVTDFRKTDPKAFSEAHRLLADLEEETEVISGSAEEWYSRGRIAFYLAGVDSDRSANGFRSTFVSAPILDRHVCRVWLSGLAEQQGYLLGEHEREVRFFRGFRQYTAGHRSEALREFVSVIADNVEDELTAIALHLAGTIQASRNFDQGTAWLERGIRLSEHLQFLENEVMARNSLIWANVRRAQMTEGSHALGNVVDTARLNVERARKSSDPSLISWSLRTSAIVAWLSITRFQQYVATPHSEDAKQLLVSLDESERMALEIGEFETAALAANDAATIYRDLGLYDLALDRIEDAIKTFYWLRSPLVAFQNLVKTAGSVRGHATDAETIRRADGLIDEMLPFLPNEARTER